MNEELGINLAEGDPRALLVGVFKGNKERPLCEESLAELKDLAETFGTDVVESLPCPIRKIDASTYLLSGKLEEIAAIIAEKQINLLIFDEEISPAQQRNLEKFLKIAVMDRTELIIEIFAQRAHTKEAQLQIELARTKYELPRLKRLWSHFSRQRASGGYLRGEGEKQIEIDRRLIKKRIEKLLSELDEVKRYRQTQASARRRSGIPTFAIVGYTNAGKSTLLNTLTQADVFVEDKLFATLDPTTRKFTLPNNQEILLTDTVGFIRKLPHTLVAAFKSTLEAALHDDVLLHLIDASHPAAQAHAEATHAILKELGADTESIITVLNKADLTERPILETLRFKFPKTVVISALHGEGLEELARRMITELEKRRTRVKLRIPQSEYALVSEVRRAGHVLHEEYDENDVVIRADIPTLLMHKFEQYLDETKENSS